MKHLLAVLLMMLAPVAAWAQEREASALTEGWFSGRLALARGAAAGTVPRVLPRDTPVVEAQDTPVVAQRRRRRNSMVGYVDDATVGTKLRLRFESGFRNRVPDRAEFFYAKCGCYRLNLPAHDPAHDPLALGPGPGIPSHLDFHQLYLSGEYGLHERLSFFVQVPIRWIQPHFAEGETGFPDAAGLGDLRAGVKLGLIDDDDRIVTVQLQAYLATGDPLQGLGTNHNSLEPALLYYQRIADRLVLEAQGGIWLPFGRSAGVPTAGDEEFAGNILYYGLGTSYEIFRTEQVQIAPVVELLDWRVLGGFQTDPAAEADATGTNIVNLKLGARAAFGPGSIYIGYGRALTRASWYEDIIRVEYRHIF